MSDLSQELRVEITEYLIHPMVRHHFMFDTLPPLYKDCSLYPLAWCHFIGVNDALLPSGEIDPAKWGDHTSGSGQSTSPTPCATRSNATAASGSGCTRATRCKTLGARGAWRPCTPSRGWSARRSEPPARPRRRSAPGSAAVGSGLRRWFAEEGPRRRLGATPAPTWRGAAPAATACATSTRASRVSHEND